MPARSFHRMLASRAKIATQRDTFDSGRIAQLGEALYLTVIFCRMIQLC